MSSEQQPIQPSATPFRRPKHVHLAGGPHDGVTVGVDPAAEVLRFPAEPDDSGSRQHRYRIAGDEGTYEGVVPVGGEGAG